MEATPPTLTGHVHVAPDADQLYDDLARALSGAADEAVRRREIFHLALSGGSTPEPFYIRLVTDPQFRNLPWQHTHVWLVDERRVPEDDQRSNFLMIRETLTDHVTLPRRGVHRVPVNEADPAAAYERELREVVGQMDSAQIPRMDFVLLGMGEDAHTASLFPHSPALRVHDALVANNEGARVTPPARITMTYPILNAARQVAVLVTGAKKAPAIQRIAAQIASSGPDPIEMPITGVCPIDGECTWYLDAAAAGGSS